MKKQLVLGTMIGATAAIVSTNVAIKTITTTGGSVTGLGHLVLGEILRPLRFIFQPFMADIK